MNKRRAPIVMLRIYTILESDSGRKRKVRSRAEFAFAGVFERYRHVITIISCIGAENAGVKRQPRWRCSQKIVYMVMKAMRYDESDERKMTVSKSR